MKKWLILLLWLALVPLSCAALPKENPPEAQDSQPPATAVYQKITPEAALEKMATPGAIVLDVRTQAEFDGGHLPGAWLIPDTEIAARAAADLPDKDALLLLYCRSGRRSANAAKELLALGYTQVYDFGGILDWPYEIVTETKTQTEAP